VGNKKGHIIPADNRLSTVKNIRKELSEMLSSDIIGACVFKKDVCRNCFSSKHHGLITENVPLTVPKGSILFF